MSVKGLGESKMVVEEGQRSGLRQVARLAVGLVVANEAMTRSGIGEQLGRRSFALNRRVDCARVRDTGAGLTCPLAPY